MLGQAGMNVVICLFHFQTNIISSTLDKNDMIIVIPWLDTLKKNPQI